MVLFSCFYSKAILKVSQIKGLRDPQGVGGTFEPFGFIEAVGMRLNRVRGGMPITLDDRERPMDARERPINIQIY